MTVLLTIRSMPRNKFVSLLLFDTNGINDHIIYTTTALEKSSSHFSKHGLEVCVKQPLGITEPIYTWLS